jgi:hypothetical protein
MSGQKIILSGVNFTDTTLPVLRDDPLLSTGSLFLFDMGHSLGKLSAVPAANGPIPNVASKEAGSLLGVDPTTLGATFFNTATTSDAKMELTAKGGLHVIMSQTNNTTTGHGAYVKLSTAVANYLIANKTHDFYLSAWARRTRAGINNGTSDGAGMRYIDIGSSANFLAAFSGKTADFRHSDQSAHADGGYNSVANRFFSNSGSAQSAETVTNANEAFAWGAVGSSFGLINVAASDVLYRVYMEDLTVSGRTYATVDALDYAMWQAAFAASGKFYGDTYTDPATFP